MGQFRYSIISPHLRCRDNMENLNAFGKEVQDFRNGVLDYTYSYNSVGNLFFDDLGVEFNKTFLKVPVKVLEYDVSKLKSVYSLGFEEFNLPSSDSTQPTDSDAEIESLKQTISKLNSLIESSSNLSEINNLKSEVMANRDVIVQLRISSGEGSSPSDFSTEFPYFPKK